MTKMTVDETTIVLSKAWNAVKGANLPEHVHSAALSIAATLLAGGGVNQSSTPMRQATPPTPPADSTSRDGDDHTPHQGDERSEAGTVDANTFFKAMAAESKRSEDDLRRLYSVKDGEVRVGVTRSALGRTESAKNRSIATLLLAAKYYVDGKKDLDLGQIRAAAKSINHEVSRNLAKHLKGAPGTYVTGTGNDKGIRVASSKFDAAFNEAADSILDA